MLELEVLSPFQSQTTGISPDSPKWNVSSTTPVDVVIRYPASIVSSASLTGGICGIAVVWELVSKLEQVSGSLWESLWLIAYK